MKELHIIKVFVRVFFRISLVAALALVRFGNAQAQSTSDTKPVLVIFHGIRNKGSDMEEMGRAANQTGMFSKVVVLSYDWRDDVIPNVAPRLFDKLNAQHPNSQFVLYGYSKGGLVAEWIASRVKPADGRISSVITVDSPLGGADPMRVEETINALPGDTKIKALFVGVSELSPDSPTIKTLKQSPINDLHAVRFVRIWGQDDKTVTQDSALQKPPGDGARYQVITISLEKGSILKNGVPLYKPTDHRAMRTFLAKKPGLLRRIFSGNLPPECIDIPIEMSDEKASSAQQVPFGWVVCTCPDRHPGLGIVVLGVQYHSPLFLCH